MKYLVTALVALGTLSGALGQTMAVIEENMYQIDHGKRLIVVNQDLDTVNNQMAEDESHFAEIQLGEEFQLINEIVEFSIGQSYEVKKTDSEEVYALYFSPFPLINITTDYVIVDEPRVYAEFVMSEPDFTITESGMGIEYRGSYSQTLPKKSFRIEFLEEEDGAEKDVKLLDLREDDDWNLQAMFNEPLRLNNLVSFELWNQIDQLYYQNLEPKAINGVRMRYAELFLNGEYRGVYAVGERIDRKQLKLKKYKNNTMKGELYKAKDWTSATMFNGMVQFEQEEYSHGWEYKYPDLEDELNWSNFQGLLDFVVNSPDEEFYANYEQHFKMENAINYFIFINTLRAADNTGKNTYIAKYDTDEPYFYVPWDLDGTFGVMWDGSNYGNIGGILSNGMYDRLLADCSPGGFSDLLREKWRILREDIITHENIMSLFNENHDLLYDSKAYEREALAWETYTYPVNQLNYHNNWITDRLEFLDNYMEGLCIYSATQDSDFAAITVYPNPTSNILNVLTEKADEYVIFSAIGFNLKSGLLIPGSNPINIQKLSPGVYFIKVGNAKAVKFIKR